MTLTILIFVLIFLILFSAFLSGSETALFSLSPFTIKSYKYSPDARKKLIFRLLEKPRELLVTIMMLNVLANLLVQNTVSSLFGTFTGWSLKIGVPLVLTLIFGEVIPKSLALPNNTSISRSVAPAIAFTAKILGPIRTRLTQITNYVSRFLFFFLKKEQEISIEDLQHVVETSKEKGVLNVEETELVSGYLDLHDSTAREVMRPPDEILFYDINEPLSKLIYLFVDQECSRVPVCDRDLENLLGIVSTRRFFFHREDIKSEHDLKNILKKPYFVPESTNAWTLLRQLRERKEDLAIVVDEYGSVSGLITQEDLFESVVGEIADRREKVSFTRSGDNVIIASGKLELDEFEDVFGKKLQSSENMVTIGGWLTEQLGDIPQAGAKYVTDDFLFYVLAADPNRVRRIYIRRLKPSKAKKK